MSVVNNSSNEQFTNNSNGFTVGGGTTPQSLTVTGANVTLTGSSANTYTFPGSSSTLAALGLAQSFTATQTFSKVNVTTGSNASAGTGTLASGTVTIATTAVTSSSLIFLTDTNSTLTNVGTLAVTAKTAGTSFTVTSSNASDSSTFNWLIVN